MVDLNAAHKHSSSHRAEIEASEMCGCFYCLSIFPPTKIVNWVDGDRTAICPYCPVDSVIGDASGFPINDPVFLKAVHQKWFLD